MRRKILFSLAMKQLTPPPKACRTLINLSASQKHKLMLASRGGVEAVTTAMRAEPKSATLAESGCWVLRNLAQNADLRHDLASKGAVDVVLAAVKQHADNPALLEQVRAEERLNFFPRHPFSPTQRPSVPFST